MTGDAEKTKDRQTDIRKSGPGVLGTRMEMHNNLIASSLYSAFFLYLYTLRPYSFTSL
jgi:hypothetical protein